MPLKEYWQKREFEKTREPRGEVHRGQDRHRFVIQKHAASRLHYDFRLELGGTLKSWAVPKGVPYTKGEKRLAVEVEDHPLSYIDFEGTIPKGQYGGGTVMVWDKGTFEPLSATPAKDLAAGKLHFILEGKKLKGEWYLVRLRGGNQWLLIRGKCDLKPVSKKMDDTSALSGKSMAQLARGNHVWNSNRNSADAKTSDEPISKKTRPTLPKLKPKKPQPSLGVGFIEPMKARLVESPPKGEWVYEIKWDGFRALALKQGDKVSLLSRNQKDFNARFPEVVEDLSRVKANEAIIDGEVVALDDKGRGSFQLLQADELGEERPPIFFYAFDLLQLNGTDLRGEPLTDRKQKLEVLLKDVGGAIRLSNSLEGSAAKLLKQAKRLGLEGLIGKRKDSRYETGRRSGAWIKLKLHHEQEFVIGGYTEPGGARQHFGALLIGYQANGGLQFGGKVGAGFNDALLTALHDRFKKLHQPDCPFENLPEKNSRSRGQKITATAMKKCHWLKPELVAQIKFQEWTRDGKLRQPVFLGLREDKDAKSVVRETPE